MLCFTLCAQINSAARYLILYKYQLAVVYIVQAPKFNLPKATVHTKKTVLEKLHSFGDTNLIIPKYGIILSKALSPHFPLVVLQPLTPARV